MGKAYSREDGISISRVEAVLDIEPAVPSQAAGAVAGGEHASGLPRLVTIDRQQILAQRIAPFAARIFDHRRGGGSDIGTSGARRGTFGSHY